MERGLPREQQRLRAPSYVAARAGRDAWGRRWGAEWRAAAAWRKSATRAVASARASPRCGGCSCSATGALDLDRRAEHFGERIEIVDWYHASEHLWTVARAVYGEGTTAATAWAAASLPVLYEQGAARFLERLHDLRPRRGVPGDVATERGYFQTNRTRMAYPVFRAASYPSAPARWNRARSMSSSSGL